MGEIAEMMLDGTLCQYCGVAMIHGQGDEAAGFPVSCGCQDDDIEWTEEDEIDAKACHLCGKRCKSEDGVLDHLRAKHPEWDADDDFDAEADFQRIALKVHVETLGSAYGAIQELLKLIKYPQNRDDEQRREIIERAEFVQSEIVTLI